MIRFFALFALTAFVCVALPNVAAAQDQTQATEQAVGFYTNGTLINATGLPPHPNLLKLFAPRNRKFATRELAQLLVGLGVHMHQLAPKAERLQIGDIAAEHGGFISGHGSHQNGLDVDIVFLRNDHAEQDPNEVAGFVESFVENGVISPNFDLPRNWEFVKAAVSSGIINRIFVDQIVKDKLCDHAKTTSEYSTETEALRRLRPWPNHPDHFHVRIKCPAGNPRCVIQDEPPEGPGC